VIGVGIATLVLWLSLGSRLGSWGCGIASGVLLACSLFAGGLGLVLLQFSLIGLFALIGVLGFVPFLMATTIARNGIRAFIHARTRGPPRHRRRGSWRPVGDGATTSLVSLRPRDRLVWSYSAEADPVRK